MYPLKISTDIYEVEYIVPYNNTKIKINPYHVELQLIRMIYDIIENNSIDIKNTPFIFSVLFVYIIVSFILWWKSDI